MSRMREFLSELKKRHVYRVAAVYGVVAWFVVQAASIVVPELDLPSWITRAIIVVAILGFPLALVLAWAYDITSQGVERTTSTESSGQPTDRRPALALSRRMRLGIAAAGLLVLTAIAVTAYAVSSGGDRVLSGDALLVELRSLADAGSHIEAFDLAQRARAEGEAIPDTLAARFTNRLTVLSDPAGARVTVVPFTGATQDVESDRIDLGVTPLRGLAIARADYHVRVEADGYAPVERPASDASTRLLSRFGGEAEMRLDVRLPRASDVPAGMVHVPGDRYQIASRDLQSLTATLADYFIDRLEVTNAQFAEFVDAGGYTRQEYWSDLAEAVSDSAAAVLSGFVDRTKLPGPRDWVGRPPAELADHPVTGVSWYEAAAYCRFRGARLPTLFEWERAARNGARAFMQGIEMPWGYAGPDDPSAQRANFDGGGTTVVGAYPFGLSAFGALDMAGNAKEWLYNRSEAGRAMTGGSFADPIYVFTEVGSMDPGAATSTVGFRCARTADRAVPASRQGDGPLRLQVESPVYEPVDEATFRTLLSHYNYDPIPLEPVVEERIETAAWTRERITYNGPAGERVLAYLFLPTSGRPPFRTVVNVPSSAAFFGNNVADLAEEALGPLVRAGDAVFTVVMKGMTERAFPPDFERPATNSVAFRDQMVLHATELRLGLDYLETRDDIDAGAIAYVGTSWGAGSRLLFAAVDDRFRAVVLVGAGIDERVHPTLPEASNINFAPHIRAPTLVVNGREDEEHPWRTRAQPLWNLLSEPKELSLFDGVGHVPPDEMRIPAIREFLDRHLAADR
ncbi:MAG TPA: SUMF1/EgtB/PvdO family nonheme iron enzyme [Longimicrobiales bacterium]|nr:SUMF1/EgtB/PvdO family nonheme iron enzyme [Longimicrobiales bacterium]